MSGGAHVCSRDWSLERRDRHHPPLIRLSAKLNVNQGGNPFGLWNHERPLNGRTVPGCDHTSFASQVWACARLPFSFVLHSDICALRTSYMRACGLKDLREAEFCRAHFECLRSPDAKRRNTTLSPPSRSSLVQKSLGVRAWETISKSIYL